MLMPLQRLQEIKRLHALSRNSRNTTVRLMSTAVDDLLKERDTLVQEIRKLTGPATAYGRVQEAEKSRALAANGCDLTRVQLDTMLAAARGESIERTAARMYVGIDTIKSRRRSALMLLGARSVSHAVAICMGRGWITAAEVLEQPAPSEPEAQS